LVTETATFAGGCFWRVEAAFRSLEGIVNTAVGYMGGQTENPTYREVCTGKTGHAEVVQVRYDPARIHYDDLLHVFWRCHDPTEVNRQGADVGSQYRSALFYHTPEQERAARRSLDDLMRSGRYRGTPRPIATQIVPVGSFWRAEEYHQQYLEKRGLVACRL
jgi:peptide-methionine (S)-S-oxide reductase